MNGTHNGHVIVVVKKNVAVLKRFFLQPLMPKFRCSEHYYRKRYKSLISKLISLKA